MKLKLDENLGKKAKSRLFAAGHDVQGVVEQGLGGGDDEAVLACCTEEGRTLVTVDRDFGEVVRSPPEKTAGIVILSVAPRAGTEQVLARLEELVLALADHPIGPELWIVEPGRIRVRADDDN